MARSAMNRYQTLLRKHGAAMHRAHVLEYDDRDGQDPDWVKRTLRKGEYADNEVGAARELADRERYGRYMNYLTARPVTQRQLDGWW